MIGTTFAYNPSTEIPSLQGKHVLITGANTGLGKQTALELARHKPSQIWMTARDPAKGETAIAEVHAQCPGVSVHHLRLDLSSLSSIEQAVQNLLASAPRLDLVFLNAGLFGHPAALTEDGYEIHMGTNHLGHAYLLKLLTPLLLKTEAIYSNADVRVISLTSIGYKYSKAQTIQFETLRHADGVPPAERYIQSKMANLLFAKEFARRVPKITMIAIHPGEVNTELFSREPGDDQIRFLQTEVAPKHGCALEEGVKNQLWAATAAGAQSGEYYEPVGVDGRGTGVANDFELARKLWEWTEAALEKRSSRDVNK